MKKRVAFFISHPIPYFAPLFRKLSSEKNIDLTVVYFSKGTNQHGFDKEFNRTISWDTDLLSGYKSIFLSNQAILPGVQRVPFGLFNMSVIGLIFRKQFDVCIIHGWSHLSHWLVLLTAKLVGIPVFLRAETPYDQELLKPWPVKLLKSIYMPLIFKMCSGFLAIGKKNKDLYRAYNVPEEKIFNTPYSVDNDYFIAEAKRLKNKRKLLRKKYQLPQNKVIILFCGKLIEKKRPQDALAAYISMKNRNNSALVFVGDGLMRKELERIVKKQKLKDVYFMGFQNQQLITEFYALADVFVLPSGLGETWGLVCNEAMCFGLPVIVSSLVGCADDLVVNNKTGLVFKYGDVLQLSEDFWVLSSNSVFRMQLARRAKQAMRLYSYESCIKSIREIK